MHECTIVFLAVNGPGRPQGPAPQSERLQRWDSKKKPAWMPSNAFKNVAALPLLPVFFFFLQFNATPYHASTMPCPKLERQALDDLNENQPKNENQKTWQSCCGTPCMPYQLPADRWELAGKTQRQSSRLRFDVFLFFPLLFKRKSFQANFFFLWGFGLNAMGQSQNPPNRKC